MEFIDLKQQYRRYQTEIDARMHQVLDHGRFISRGNIAETTQFFASPGFLKHFFGFAFIQGSQPKTHIFQTLGFYPTCPEHH